MASNQRARRRVLVGVAAGVPLLVLLTSVIITFPFQLARNDGRAMEPALEDRQRLVVNKLVYWLRDPMPGDVVMGYSPLDPNKSFVQRVIARQGDTVRIIAGIVYVNGKPLSEDYVPSEFRSQDNWGPQIVPEGYYFVLGDHRSESSDSRHWGYVPRRYIIGKIAAMFGGTQHSVSVG
jgi:signal peptidase I